MDRDDSSRSMPGGLAPGELTSGEGGSGAFDVTEMSADDIATKIARRMELWRSTQLPSGRRVSSGDAGLYGEDFAILLADRPSFAPAMLQDLARRSWKFAGLTVIRRRIVARAGIGARLARLVQIRGVRMASRRAAKGAHAMLVAPPANFLVNLAAGARAAVNAAIRIGRATPGALWRNVRLLPGDLRSAGSDLAAGAAAILRRARDSAGWRLLSHPRAMAAAGALLVLLGAGAMLPLDRILPARIPLVPMRQTAGMEAPHPPRDMVEGHLPEGHLLEGHMVEGPMVEAARTAPADPDQSTTRAVRSDPAIAPAPEPAPDPALASTRRRDLDRAAAAPAPRGPGPKHPPAMVPWLKPTTRAAAPEPDLRQPEPVPTAAPAMLVSAPSTPLDAKDEATPRGAASARARDTADDAGDAWMLDWIYSDGVQRRLP